MDNPTFVHDEDIPLMMMMIMMKKNRDMIRQTQAELKKHHLLNNQR